jgi:hypothetical protein
LNEYGELLVDDTEVERDSFEFITWKLDDDTLADMRFVPKNSLPLNWISERPWHVFSPPDVSDDRRQLTIQDKHQGSGTTGHFIYQLRVEKVNANGTRQRFTTTRAAGGSLRTSDNPVIINR